MFRASQEKIKDFLFVEGNILKIPKYQRPYSWYKDQIDDFWDDLIENDGSFIGTFILSSEHFEQTKELEVIDGQQRLLTITIFLAVLRDIAKTLGYRGLSERIQKKTIVTEDFSGKVENRVEVGDGLKKTFTKFIQGQSGSSDVKFSSKEERLVHDNYEYFVEKVDELIKKIDPTTKEKKLQDLLEKISSIDCVLIRITNDEDAYAIFETVNDRGVDLSVADLLKNFVFKQLEIEGKLKYGQEQWSKLTSNVLDVGADLQKFLRYFWLSKYGFVTERDLYKAIKKSKLSASCLMDELVLSSDLYLKIINNNRDDWNDFDHSSQIHQALSGIDIMAATQCHVLFLAVLRNVNSLGGNVKRIFQTIEKFTFMYSAISKLQTNKIEKLYSRYAVKLEDESKTESKKNKEKNINRIVDEFINELKVLKPAENIFIDKFSEIGYKNSTKGRNLISYILSGLNSGKTGGEMAINFDIVNIEHIIPQNPGKDWEITKKDTKNYGDLLGNLVLVHKEYNSKAGNKSLKEKCAILRDTEIVSTKELIESIIANKFKWDEQSIKNRQKQLAVESFNLWTY